MREPTKPNRVVQSLVTSRVSWAIALTITALAMGGAGCNILGPAYVLIAGPPKTQAQFELDKDRMHVVVIDDMRSRLPRRSVRTRISQAAETDLIRETALAADDLIPGNAAHTIMQDETVLDRMSIVDIGRRIGADVVIYVIVDLWELTRDNVSTWPRAMARVKVLDVNTNSRIWPAGEGGFSLTIEPFDLRSGDFPTSLAGRTDLEEALAQSFGRSVAQIFYKHVTREAAKD